MDPKDHKVSDAEPAKLALPDTPTLLSQQLQERMPAIEAALQADVSKMQRRRIIAPMKNRASLKPKENSVQPLPKDEDDEEDL